jgi:peptidyl-prolyl cis-trans isomerase D
MLSFLRKNAGTWLIKGILGAIVVVFVFWGVGSFRNESNAWVAKINGETVSAEQYNEAYNTLIQRYRSAYGQRFNDEMIKMLNLKQQALNQLIEKQLLLNEAGRLKFMVSSDELIDSIRTMTVFQNNGVFDEKRYRAVLTQNRLTPESFEKIQKELLLVDKLRSFVIDSVHVSENEIMEWFNWKHTSMQIDYALVDPAQLTDIVVNDDEIGKYFEEHRDEFKTEPKRIARYIEIKSATFADQVAITEDEIKAYYETHSAEFEKPKTVEARHILFRLAQDASAEAVEKSRIKALDVLKLIKDGKDFAELAKQYSDDPAKENGGYLGEFKKEDMVQPFSEKAFSMKAGEISDPVRTQFGWHIIKVEKINEPSTQTLDQASQGIRKKLTDERAGNMAFDAATTLGEKIMDINSFEKAAEEGKYTITITEPFTRKGPKEMAAAPKFAETVFSLEKDSISDVLDLGEGRYSLVQVMDIIPETIPELQAIKEAVRAAALKGKQQNQAAEIAAKILEAVKQGKTMAAAGAQKGVKTATTEFFERNGRIAEIGYEPEVIKTAFDLSLEKKVADATIKGQKGYYVIAFKDRKAADPAGLEKEKDQILQTLKSQKQNQVFQKLLETIRKASDIQISKSFT